MKTLAVDIGGPIIRRSAGSSLDEYRQASPEVDAFDSIRRLASEFDQIHLISQCSPDLQAVKIDWISRHYMFLATGLAAENVHFVRNPEDKATLCKFIKATHFVDDRAEILNHALGVVDHLYLYRPNYDEAVKFPGLLNHSHIVLTWKHLMFLLTE